jgi:sugar/nucleoside kinase (ribokinase family)
VINKKTAIAAVGAWVMDHVHLVNTWPQEQGLAYIDSMKKSPGGLAYNVLVDLAKFGLDIPLEGAGFVGSDDDGRLILQNCDDHGIDRKNVQVVDGMPTAYTEVMTVKSSGRRTFFHSKSTNNLLNYETVPFDQLHSGMVHFGYLLLLDGIDAPDPEYGTVAARILHRFQEMGFRTSVDAVSEDSGRYLRLIPAALKYTDYLIINELEAGRTTGHDILEGDQINTEALRESAAQLLAIGSARLVVIHMHVGAYVLTRNCKEFFQPSFDLPPDYIKGAMGAGDAFCAGILAGIHEEWDMARSLRFATAAGAAALREPDATSGICDAQQLWEFFERFPLRDITL